MSLSKETIEYIAHLARLSLSDEEEGRFLRQLQDILDFIDVLKKTDIKNIEPTTHSVASSNIFRQDTPADSLSSNQALSNAPVREDNFFVVPKIIE